VPLRVRHGLRGVGARLVLQVSGLSSDSPRQSHPPVWVDGRIVPLADAGVSVLSHAVQRGAAVFDVGAMRPRTVGSPLLFRPREHIARFLRSASLVGLSLSWDAEALMKATIDVARASGISTALVRWSAFVPGVEPDVVPRTGARASVAIAVLPPDPATPTADARPPLRVTIPSDFRKAGPEVFPPDAKVGASYLGPMLAKRQALGRGFDEVILLDRDGHLAEAPTANVFVVREGELLTPPLGRILPGITRESILALARAEGLSATEAALSRADLEGADEAFVTATSFPVLGIGSIDTLAYRLGAPGPMTARLRDLLLACERGEDPRFAAWVVPV
jgi:branched-chain amino acid aminotransferase